jgi:hypothetical protein
MSAPHPGLNTTPGADLQLPVPPDIAAGTVGKRSGAGLIIALVIALGVTALCVCGGFVAAVTASFGAMQEPARAAIDPWLSALKQEDYETAARAIGPGVTANQVRDEVDRHIGVPLQSWDRDKSGVGIGADETSPDAITIRYTLTGSRGSVTVDIGAPMVSSHTPGQPSRVTVPAWGLVPKRESPRHPPRVAPERAPGPESAPRGRDPLSLGEDTAPPRGAEE